LAHADCVLDPDWAKYLKDGPVIMRARQCSAKGGELLVTGDMKNDRVVVAGQLTISQEHSTLPTSLLKCHVWRNFEAINTSPALAAMNRVVRKKRDKFVNTFVQKQAVRQA